jgi:hypothetical protein
MAGSARFTRAMSRFRFITSSLLFCVLCGQIILFPDGREAPSSASIAPIAILHRGPQDAVAE